MRLPTTPGKRRLDPCRGSASHTFLKNAILVAAAALAGAGLMYWKSQRDIAGLRADWEGRLRQAAAAQSAAPQTSGAPQAPVLPPSGVRPAGPALPPGPAQTADTATHRELLRLIDEKNARITESERTLGELRERVTNLEARLAAAAEESTKLNANLADVQERLNAQTRLAETLEAQARSREERLAQAETTNRDLRRRNEDTAKRFSRLAEISTQFDDLARRREGYLNNVLRRYREATELFRTLALRLDNPRDAAAPTSNDLSRIQQALTAADEDLRQLNTINAQVARLGKELSAARR